MGKRTGTAAQKAASAGAVGADTAAAPAGRAPARPNAENGARRAGTPPARLSTFEAAKTVLKQASGPMHAKDITAKVKDMPGVRLKGATPQATIAAMLAVAAKKKDTFVKTAPNTYALKDKP